jgi:hypothetical protein
MTTAFHISGEILEYLKWKGSTHRLQFWRFERREAVMHPMMCHGKTKRTVYGRGTKTQSFAVNRYQMGERPSKICESVGRSRTEACENGLEDTTIPIKTAKC